MYYRIINGVAESRQLDINGLDGIWAPETEGFSSGDLYDEDNGWSHPRLFPHILTTEEIENEAKQWRDTELLLTDSIVPITDHPDHTATIAYRQELRDWPLTAAFPSTKPTI
tara:strand:- start:75 stop:410 length:336 start_codon:yes stop_codon:yes gene_type:complete